MIQLILNNNKTELFVIFKKYLLELSTDLINNSDKWKLLRFDYKVNSLLELVDSIEISFNDQFIFNLDEKTITVSNREEQYKNSPYNETDVRLGWVYSGSQIFKGLLISFSYLKNFSLLEFEKKIIDNLENLNFSKVGEEMMSLLFYSDEDLLNLFPTLLTPDDPDLLTKRLKSEALIASHFNFDKNDNIAETAIDYFNKNSFNLDLLKNHDSKLNKITKAMFSENSNSLISAIYSTFELSLLSETIKDDFSIKLELMKSGISYYNDFLDKEFNYEKGNQIDPYLINGFSFAGAVLGTKLPLKVWEVLIDKLVSDKKSINLKSINKTIFNTVNFISKTFLDSFSEPGNESIRCELLYNFVLGITEAFYQLNGYKLKLVTVFPFPHQAAKSNNVMIYPIIAEKILRNSEIKVDTIFYANNLMWNSFNSLSDVNYKMIKDLLESNFFDYVDDGILKLFEG